MTSKTKSSSKTKKSSYNKAYYLKHKAKILTYLKQKVKCRCGASVSRSNLASHLKTTKHKQLLKQNQTPTTQTQ